MSKNSTVINNLLNGKFNKINNLLIDKIPTDINDFLTKNEQKKNKGFTPGKIAEHSVTKDWYILKEFIMNKKIIFSKENTGSWRQSNLIKARKECIVEFLVSEIFARGVTHAPKNGIAYSKDVGNLFVKSKIIPNARDLETILNSPDFSLENISNISNLEKAIIMSLLIGDIDYTKSNLLCDSNGVIIKIDHGKAGAFVISGIKSLTSCIDETFSFYGYNALIDNGILKFDLRKVFKAIENITAKITPEIIDNIIDKKLFFLKKLGFNGDLKLTKCYMCNDAFEIKTYNPQDEFNKEFIKGSGVMAAQWELLTDKQLITLIKHFNLQLMVQQDIEEIQEKLSLFKFKHQKKLYMIDLIKQLETEAKIHFLGKYLKEFIKNNLNTLKETVKYFEIMSKFTINNDSNMTEKYMCGNQWFKQACPKVYGKEEFDPVFFAEKNNLKISGIDPIKWATENNHTIPIKFYNMPIKQLLKIIYFSYSDICIKSYFINSLNSIKENVTNNLNWVMNNFSFNEDDNDIEEYYYGKYLDVAGDNYCYNE